MKNQNNTPSLLISLTHLSISNGTQVLKTRSRALLVFVCCLVVRRRTQSSAWIGIEALRGHLPSVHGKQLQRFIDALAEIKFPVGYESKTRGRYCLAAPLEQISFDVDEAAVQAFIAERVNLNWQCASAAPPLASNPVALPVAGAGSHLQTEALLASLSQINLADSQYHDGNLDHGSNHAYDILRREIETAAPTFKAIVLLKFARVCRRLQRYGEAQTALRTLRKMLRSDEVISKNLEFRLELSLCMLRLDQGRLEDARSILDALNVSTCADDTTLSKYHNLMGLLAAHTLQASYKKEAPAWVLLVSPAFLPSLELAAQHYHRALTLAVSSSDYQSMQSICANLGHLYLSAYQVPFSKLAHSDFLSQGIGWIAQCDLICNKFGVGMDSVSGRIALLETALNEGLTLQDLIKLSGGMFKNYANLEAMAESTLAESIRIGNRIEQSAALSILAQLAKSRGDGQTMQDSLQQAQGICRILKRADLMRALKA